MRRKTYSKLPLQGNVYPMPSLAYIEDDHMRFTVLSGQPSGVACLKSGNYFKNRYFFFLNE
jgi:alpha-mannosidase II